MPKVSVIIPVYNVENYIQRCARSLFEQSLDDIEYLFIDDCSPDRSIQKLRDIIDEYPERKDQIRIHRMPHNSGQAKVRKWGVLHASGEYVIHCDSDDWLDPQMYEIMYEEAIKDNADLVICDYWESDGNSKKYIRNGNHENPSYLFEFYHLWARLTKKSIIEKLEYYPSGNMGEDRVYAVQTGFYSKRIIKIDQALYYYYQNNDSICRNQSKDNCLKNFSMRYENTRMIQQFIQNKGLFNEKSLIKLKFQTLSWLIPLLKDNTYLKVWNETFPELRHELLKSREMSTRDKIKYFIISTGIYTKYKLLFSK